VPGAPRAGGVGSLQHQEANVLTHNELRALERALRGESVLSVYIDGSLSDPAARRSWRVELNRELEEKRAALATATGGDEKFERCVAQLDERLSRYSGLPGDPGWVAIITVDRVHVAEPLGVPVDTKVFWETGIHVAPLMRALKHSRPVIIALVDAVEAQLYRWWGGELTPLKGVHAGPGHEPVGHLGHPPSQHFHPGVRGVTGHDAAGQAAADETEHMLGIMAERALRFANGTGWFLVGGVPRVRAAASALLSQRAPGRVLELDALDVHASEAQIREAAQQGASAMRSVFELHQIAEMVDRAGPTGRATLGPDTTRRALELSRVHELYMTHHFMEAHPADAELAVRSALEQGATVEEVSGVAAQQLDEFGGLAARLRYEFTPRARAD
jgi:hypothetical protein